MSGFTERLIGLQLGGFVIRRYIARGGMGVVYEGLQPSLERAVAVKVLYPHLSDAAAFIERFQREARAIAQLRHPNIVQIIDAGADQGYYYMVMELVDGQSLRERLVERQQRGAKLETTEAAAIIAAIGGALAYAHRRGFVHRDIKPGNVLLDRDGGAHLSDFGLVKALGADGITQTGAMLGTPEYMAPEQYTGVDEVGPAADQYAFAVVAYELLTGRVPFSATTPAAVLHKHVNEPPPPPRSFEPQLSAEVSAVLLRGLAKSPAQRYPSVEAFVSDISRALASDTTRVDAAPPLANGALAATMPTAGAFPPLAALAPPATEAGGASSLPPTPAAAAPLMSEPPPAAGVRQRRRWLAPLAGLAAVVVAAATVAAVVFGGGGGGGPAPTQVAGELPTAQVAIVAEPTATATLPPVVAIAATATQASAPATATNAVSTLVPTERPTSAPVRRPIEATATPRARLQPLPFATGTPQSAAEAGQTVVVYQDFSTGEAGPFVVGDSQYGNSALSNGAFVMSIPANSWLSSVPDPAIDLANGGVALDVTLTGDGSAGIVARSAKRADGSAVLYACWLNTQGAAGCATYASNAWNELFKLDPEAVPPRDVNRLIVVMVNDQLVFQANDVVVGQARSDASASGGWGMYADSATGTTTASFAQIVISTVSDDYLNQ